MKRARKTNPMDIPSVPPLVTQWTGVDISTKTWLPKLSRFRTRLRDAQAFLSSRQNRALAKLGAKYVLAYTSIAVIGAHVSILMFEGVHIWKQFYLLATFSPIAIALPIAIHGVSIRVKALKSGAQFKHLLDHDDLTGLKSRRYVLEQLNQRPSPFNYIFMIDMDRLKRLNDQIGHHAGDAALIRLARALAASAKENDVVRRLSGDEFMILTTTNSTDDATTMAQNALQEIYRTNRQCDNAETFTISIGIAELATEPVHASSPSKTVHEADKALYRAKQKGGNHIQFAVSPEDASPTILRQFL